GFADSAFASALGAARDCTLAEDVAFMLGRELAALGINWNFAPVADIAHQPDNPSVSTRSVGEDGALVSQIVSAQIRGFQRAGVAATVKHFPGLGNTIIDTHDALAKVSGSLNYLYENDLFPFRDAINADVACVMLTHVMYEALDEAHPATLSPRIVTGLLRSEFGYDGAVCTDCMEMKAITDGFGAGEAAVLAVEAGVDMPLYSHSRRRQQAAYQALLRAVKSGRIPQSRIDESVARIQALKADYALKDRPQLDVVACEAHQALALRAARAGLVMVKRGSAWPIDSQNTKIALIEFVSRQVSDAVDRASNSQFSRSISERIGHVPCLLLDPTAPDSKSIEFMVGEADVVILVTRNAHMHRKQRQLAQRIIDLAKRVILVCARNTYDAGLLTRADTIICSNGDSRPSLVAAAEAVCGEVRPNGELTVRLK
ncbi:MAG: hypothetical protein OXG78_11685, partial [Chloroflexi bacterium]|nr:hypothetical protein [Chloroflexota bacterium]